jgi:hypothetical protein
MKVSLPCLHLPVPPITGSPASPVVKLTSVILGSTIVFYNCVFRAMSSLPIASTPLSTHLIAVVLTCRVVRPCTGILAPEDGKRQISDGLYNRLNCLRLTVNII